MPDLLAGSTILSLDTTATQVNVQSGSYTITTTTYSTATTGGTYADCAVTFTAPTTGRVLISLAARMTNSTTAGTLMSPETRTGGTVGSGTVVESAADGTCIANYSGSFVRCGSSHVLSGLTPGAVYNTRLLHKINTASTGTIALRELIVQPLA